MDREKSVRRPFGFVSFSSEKTAEEVLRQQRHSVNGASIEVRPAKPRPHEQQQLQMQQQYQYGDYLLPHHHNALISSMSNSTITHQPMMGVHANQNSYYTTSNNNYPQQIDQWSQGANNGSSYWSTANTDIRNNNNSTSVPQWSSGNSSNLRLRQVLKAQFQRRILHYEKWRVLFSFEKCHLCFFRKQWWFVICEWQ